MKTIIELGNEADLLTWGFVSLEYEVVPDIEPVPEKWHTVGTLMLTGIMVVLAVVCILLFFTGVWVWSLLI